MNTRDDTTLACPPAGDRAALTRGFNVTILISGARCTMTYLVLPFLVPILGLAPGIGPVVGLAIGTVAIAANLWSIRRFSRARHPWRRPVVAIHLTVIGLLVVLAAGDISTLVA